MRNIIDGSTHARHYRPQYACASLGTAIRMRGRIDGSTHARHSGWQYACATVWTAVRMREPRYGNGTRDRGNHSDAVPLIGHQGAADTAETTPCPGLSASLGTAGAFHLLSYFCWQRKGGEEGETTKKSKENFDMPSNPLLNA
ncbi:uncharacterized protein LOC121110573 isoform X2 [Gallus gallus]|uniref:uncharacterized protein LOC121110573 isoform X2 n=1 Tax=Gallus gallus TaxID=9031 RepID=UPI001F01B251|nr:uncharacterized protein LOC121110573 isoform X2 [Gallus gallus]